MSLLSEAAPGAVGAACRWIVATLLRAGAGFYIGFAVHRAVMLAAAPAGGLMRAAAVAAGIGAALLWHFQLLPRLAPVHFYYATMFRRRAYNRMGAKHHGYVYADGGPPIGLYSLALLVLLWVLEQRVARPLLAWGALAVSLIPWAALALIARRMGRLWSVVPLACLGLALLVLFGVLGSSRDELANAVVTAFGTMALVAAAAFLVQMRSWRMWLGAAISWALYALALGTLFLVARPLDRAPAGVVAPDVAEALRRGAATPYVLGGMAAALLVVPMSVFRRTPFPVDASTLYLGRRRVNLNAIIHGAIEVPVLLVLAVVLFTALATGRTANPFFMAPAVVALLFLVLPDIDVDVTTASWVDHERWLAKIRPEAPAPH